MSGVTNSPVAHVKKGDDQPLITSDQNELRGSPVRFSGSLSDGNSGMIDERRMNDRASLHLINKARFALGDPIH